MAGSLHKTTIYPPNRKPHTTSHTPMEAVVVLFEFYKPMTESRNQKQKLANLQNEWAIYTLRKHWVIKMIQSLLWLFLLIQNLVFNPSIKKTNLYSIFLFHTHNIKTHTYIHIYFLEPALYKNWVLLDSWRNPNYGVFIFQNRSQPISLNLKNTHKQKSVYIFW